MPTHAIEIKACTYQDVPSVLHCIAFNYFIQTPARCTVSGDLCASYIGEAYPGLSTVRPSSNYTFTIHDEILVCCTSAVGYPVEEVILGSRALSAFVGLFLTLPSPRNVSAQLQQKLAH